MSTVLRGKRRQPVHRKILAHWQYYLLLALPLTYIIVFAYIPMPGVLMAFQRFSVKKGLFGSPWVGLANFRQFLSSPSSLQIIFNSLRIGIYSLVAGFPIPILLAIGLNEVGSRRFKKSVQMITYAPYFISTVVIVGMILQLTNLRTGLLNKLIVMFGGSPVDFMSKPGMFSSIYVWSGVWQGTGYSAIIYLAALAGVSKELQEAAIVDGASRLKRIWHVDLPCIRHQILILFIFSMSGIINVGFDKAFLLQNTLNASASEVIATFVYKVALVNANADYGFSQAVALFNTIVSVILLLLTNFVVKRLSETSIW